MKTDQQGLTLLEVLTSVFLLTLALVPLLQLYPTLLDANRSYRDLEQLGLVAASKLEELSTSLRDGTTGAGSGSQPCDAAPGCVVSWVTTQEAFSPTPGVGSLWHVEVTACSDTNGDGCGTSDPQVRYQTRVTTRP